MKFSEKYAALQAKFSEFVGNLTDSEIDKLIQGDLQIALKNPQDKMIPANKDDKGDVLTILKTAAETGTLHEELTGALTARKYTNAVLKAVLKRLNIRGYSKLNKKALITSVEENIQQQINKVASIKPGNLIKQAETEAENPNTPVNFTRKTPGHTNNDEQNTTNEAQSGKNFFDQIVQNSNEAKEKNAYENRINHVTDSLRQSLDINTSRAILKDKQQVSDKTELLDVAKRLGVPVSKSASQNSIIESILDVAVQSRINSLKLRGKFPNQ